ncbi:peptidase M16 [Vibrio sp. UCD-FRSSP16_10]|uniref:insulinase family protein n=1 Tax=unclassified Vibrio TaxID=2614977 RepID=UPI0007FE67DC|nr:MULTISPECIES: insulinase family protein [unclassified Vibrio]OBT15873.1 peptidase M16 [Vibrio sp. UCD-FRSSP16_10]OBT17767.1 peptidase M16 [Vibrio sp. UCD-FRSSP16_30]
MHQSPNDNNSYRPITLNNQIKVILVHDPKAQRSAASLAVRVGHFDDPSDREGLAHYLEHMLFLGTKAYPKVGEFQTFISQHGGSNNAWTGTEHTCFFFDILPQFFEPALSRFSQFFISPLFNQEALDKERQAVNSEYQMKIHDDSRRFYQVQKELVNPAHPFSKFSVGNEDTLSDHEASDDKSGTIRDEIITFYEQQYCAQLMTVVLVGPQSLDELETFATQQFSDIKNNGFGDKTVTTPLLTPDQQQLYVQVEPEKDVRKLSLSFSFPNMEKYYATKPLSYFAHLIGYEGPGSLTLILKNKHWITSLAAGGGISGSNFREFSIGCILTEEGLKHTDEIVELIFSYMNLVFTQGIEQWRYGEKQAVLESAFRFQESIKPMDLASYLVMNLQRFPVDEVLYGDYRMSDFDFALIESFVPYFCIENLRVWVTAKDLEYDKQAKWYFTPYSVQPFSEQQIKRWKNPVACEEFALPSKNPFICYDLDPKPLQGNDALPVLIEELPGLRLWHLQEPDFRVPKGSLYIAIDSPCSVNTPHNIVKLRLCVELFMETLSRQSYQAEIAGMSYNIYAHQGGLTLTISGFSEKQPQLLKMIIDKFATRNFDSQRFDIIKAQMLRKFRNVSKDRPLSQLFNQLSGILQPNNPPAKVLADALEEVTVEQLPEFVATLLGKLYVEMFVFGDWTRDAAHALADDLKNALRMENQQYKESLRPLVKLGNKGTFQKEIHCNQDDSAVAIYYQGQDSQPLSIATFTLANHLMSSAFFNEIRTKQQLGYMVGTGNMPLNRIPGIVVYVQSPVAAPIDLVASIDEFLNAFYMVLLELTEAQWQNSKQGLLNQIMAPDNNLRTKGQRFWVSIGNKDKEFNNRELVVEKISTLTRADMIRFVVNQLKPRTANRLVMHTQGNQHHDAPHLELGKEIGSIEEFQLMPKDVELG